MALNEYIGKSDLLLIFNLIKTEVTKYVKAVEGKGLSTNDFTDALLAKLNSIDLTAIQASIDAKAPLASPTLTGTPTAPTPASGDNSTLIATTAFVTSAIATAIASITGITFDGPYSSYNDLVSQVVTPRQGTIYLVSNSGSIPNANDEYFWTGKRFELFGTTAIDLSSYLKKSDVTELSTTEVQAAWDSVFAT